MLAPLLRGTVPSPGEGTQPVAAERIAWTWNATTEALTTLPQPASVGRVRVSGGVLTNVMDETIYVGAEGNRVYALVPRTGEVSEALYHPTMDTRKDHMHGCLTLVGQPRCLGKVILTSRGCGNGRQNFGCAGRSR